MIYLYVKTHDVTGLKYLGKTIQDPYKYKGSGKRWLNHLNKHGNHVTTTILLATESKEELKETGIFFSKMFGVKSSPDWANIKDEEGDGGDFWSGLQRSEETRERVRRSLTGRTRTPETKAKIKSSIQTWYKDHPEHSRNSGTFLGKKHSPETIEKMRKLYECPHCGKVGRGSPMKQWHFDNCKLK